jgi:hypothetical protein
MLLLHSMYICAPGSSRPSIRAAKVHPVAVEVTTLRDHVAQRDPDAQRDLPILGQDGVALSERALHLQRRTHRVDCARELAQRAVAGDLEMRPPCARVRGSNTSVRRALSVASVPASLRSIRRE